MVPETRYAVVDGVHVAYQVLGDGPLDLVFVTSWVSHIEVQWEEPLIAAFLNQLASFGRLVLFDKRGMGMSDPVVVDERSSVDEWIADITAVMSATGTERAAIVGFGAGGPLSILFAATHPEAVTALVLINAWARLRRDRDHPFGLPMELEEPLLELLEAGWASTGAVDLSAPSLLSEPSFQRWHRRHLRLSASPGTAVATQRMLFRTDVREVLPSVRAPTLVLHRVDNQSVRIGHARHLAANIPNAELVELGGADHPYWAGDVGVLAGEIERFLTGAIRPVPADRTLATVLFTDLVDSTPELERRGDAHWRAVLDRHDQAVRHQIERFGGRLVKTTGDGVVAVFDAPSRAVRCACAIRDAVRALDLYVRVGVHTGEIEYQGDDIAGIAVHVAARVVAIAEPGEILATSTVCDLAAGSLISFHDRGTHTLKGVSSPWRLFSIET
jgi:class 3 adenylate cyclase